MGKKNATGNLTKRIVVRASKKGVKKASEDTIDIMGYNIVAKNGWLMKVNKDGSTENIERIYSETTNVLLD